jgi:predicted RNase H-like HicB family nuclease/uncharacterized damage-inducible protein DinB
VSGTIAARETAQGWLASVVEVPGCIARAPTKDAAVAAVRRALPEYLALLEKYGVSTEHWQGLDPAALAVSEYTAEEWFAADFRPLEEHEIRDFLHQMEGSRSALLALVREISPAEIERKPTTDMWSVRETLEHIMTTEASLLSRLESWPDQGFATLQAVHRMAFQRFSILEPEDAQPDRRVFGQRWSTRRVMRRILEHEHEHREHIKEILAALGGDRQPS